MRLRTLVLVTVVGTGALGFASDAFAQRRPSRSEPRSYRSYRSYRPAPRYYDNRYSRPYRYSYNYNYRPYSYGYRPYSYGYRPYSYGYGYDPYYYSTPYYYEPYYYGTPPYVPYSRYRGYRPRVGINLHLGW